MRRSRRTDLLRSASLRLALVYAVLFMLSAVVFMSFIWWATIGLLEREVDVSINADIRALSERWVDGGPSALADAIALRMAANVDDDALYLVVDPAGTAIAGNLPSWPTGIARSDVVYQLRIQRDGMRGLADVKAVALPGGYRMLVGRDVRARAILKRLLTDTLLWAVVMVGVLGISGAFVVRSLFRRMVRNVARTTRAIASGDLAQRVPLSGSGDEFDRVAETINDMLDRIARLMNGVRQVSNSIAHDLRTPITRARARLEDAALHASGTAEMRAAIERAVTDLDGVTAVFEALLRIAEIEAGSRRSAFAPLELSGLLDDIAELYQAVAEENGLVFVRLPSPPIHLSGDRPLIQQAVANLLDNAIKFSPPGGSVTLCATSDGRQVSITVRDDGIGMTPAEAARAPERFYRAESARSTPGSGLGLSLVQAVAQLHAGRFDLRTRQNQDGNGLPGLDAVLVLPVQEGGHVTEGPGSGPGSGPGPPSGPGQAMMEPPSSTDHPGETMARLSSTP
jgi:signal transduction histidine kinase